MEERPVGIPYGLITEEAIEWRTSKLLRALAALGPDADGLEMFPVVKQELWEVAMEATHHERGGILGVIDPKTADLLVSVGGCLKCGNGLCTCFSRRSTVEKSL